jgi:alkylation response protein AidB-like acyl-CoA dehydrogenase
MMTKNKPARNSDRLFSDIFMPEETLAVRREVRQFAEDVLHPVAHEINTTPEAVSAFRRDIFDQMAAAGIYTLPYAAEFGGRGLEFPTLATFVAMEEMAYFVPGLTSALYDGQAILVGKTLEASPGAMRDLWLPKLVRGEFIGSFATSEPAASTDLSVRSIQTVAQETVGGWLVSGRKRWITNSSIGDICLTLCRTGESLTMLLIDLHAEGVRVGAPDRKMGNHAQLTSDIWFDDVFVPAENVVGEIGGGLRTALGALALGRMGVGAMGTGMAQAAFDYAVAHMQRREVFGQKLGAFQHWQFRFADHATGIENARSLYLKAAFRHDRTPGDVEPQAAMAKIAGSELAVNVSRDAIQVCGGYGFVRELSATGETFPLESIYRDAKIGEIYEGANEVQRVIIARAILGRAITG